MQLLVISGSCIFAFKISLYIFEIKMAKITKAEITKERLIELGNSLNEIMQELIESIDAPEHNPKKKDNKREQEIARLMNEIAGKSI